MAEDLSGLKRDDLLKVAEDEGVDVPKSANKAQIVEAIEAKRGGSSQPESQVRSDNRLPEKQKPNPDPHAAGTGSADGMTHAQRVDAGKHKPSRKPSLSLSGPPAENTQLFITGRNFPAREQVSVEIKTPGGMIRRSSRADVNGTVQAVLNNPDAGKHRVTFKAGKSSKSLDFEVSGGNNR